MWPWVELEPSGPMERNQLFFFLKKGIIKFLVLFSVSFREESLCPEAVVVYLKIMAFLIEVHC